MCMCVLLQNVSIIIEQLLLYHLIENLTMQRSDYGCVFVMAVQLVELYLMQFCLYIIFYCC